MSNRNILIVFIISLILSLWIICSLWSSRLYSREILINIDSWRVKKDDYILYYLYKSEIIENTISKIINKPDDINSWRVDSSISPWIETSPYYRFHWAIFDLQKLSSIFDMQSIEKAYCINNDKKKQIINKLLASWKYTDSRIEWSNYIKILEKDICISSYVED